MLQAIHFDLAIDQRDLLGVAGRPHPSTPSR